jgi:hypothetical protein
MEEIKPSPDKAYRQLALRLKALVEQGAPKERIAKEAYYNEHHSIEAKMLKQFKGAFGLTNDRYGRASKFFARLLYSELKPNGIFDHHNFFQRGSNLVVVSQPYGIDLDELGRWTKLVGADYVIADEWGFYYPGKASLFIVEFTPYAKEDLDKRLRKLRRSLV